MEREPAERYGTAQELADDLRNYLEDRAICARRPSLANQVGRWCRRHKALVRGTATVLFLVLLGVGFSLGWRRWQLAALEQEVGTDLQAADLFQKQDRWAEELQALERASGRLATGSLPHLHERVEQRRKNVTMVARLEDARLWPYTTEVGADGFDYKAADEAYAAAFASHDLNVEGLEPEVAAERVQKSPIRKHLVAALDDWAFVRKKLRAGSEGPLRCVAGLVDDDPWRQQLRDPEVSKDQGALERLAGAEDVLNQLAGNLVFLGRLLAFGNAKTTAVGLLRRAQQRYPADFWISYELAHRLFDEPATKIEAIGFYRVAVALRPQSSFVHGRLGRALFAQGQLPEAEAAFRKETELAPGFAKAFNNLGFALAKQNKLGAAEAAYRKAIALDPGYATAYGNLGGVFKEQGKLTDAVAAYKQALRLDPNDAEGYNTLGNALQEQGKLPEAVDAYNMAIDLKPGLAEPYYNLANTLRRQGNLPEAVTAYNEAIRRKADYAEAYNNLGIVLRNQGKLPEAVTAHNKAIQLKADNPAAYNNIGVVLHDLQKWPEAEAAIKEAIRLKADFAEAYSNLGGVYLPQNKLSEAADAFDQAIKLKPDYAIAHRGLGETFTQQGRFADALAEERQAHKLGSRNPGWPDAKGQRVRDAERRVELDAKLPAYLSGQAKPANSAEWFELVHICRFKKLWGGVARCFSEAFALGPSLADDVRNSHRYNAACAGALAGCGQGLDADELDEKERARLRRQALDWLRADLKVHQQAMNKALVAEAMQNWLKDTDFNGVRGSEALAKLPENERQDWQKLWEEVESLRQRAAKPQEK